MLSLQAITMFMLLLCHLFSNLLNVAVLSSIHSFSHPLIYLLLWCYLSTHCLIHSILHSRCCDAIYPLTEHWETRSVRKYKIYIEQVWNVTFKMTRRYGPYAGQLLAPAKGFGKGIFWAKKAYYAVFVHFRPYLVLSSNFSDL